MSITCRWLSLNELWIYFFVACSNYHLLNFEIVYEVETKRLEVWYVNVHLSFVLFGLLYVSKILRLTKRYALMRVHFKLLFDSAVLYVYISAWHFVRCKILETYSSACQLGCFTTCLIYQVCNAMNCTWTKVNKNAIIHIA